MDDVPNWGKYMMLIASIIGAYLLARELHAAHWPKPF
jgi:hypothetical protein